MNNPRKYKSYVFSPTITLSLQSSLCTSRGLLNCNLWNRALVRGMFILDSAIAAHDHRWLGDNDGSFCVKEGWKEGWKEVPFGENDRHCCTVLWIYHLSICTSPCQERQGPVPTIPSAHDTVAYSIVPYFTFVFLLASVTECGEWGIFKMLLITSLLLVNLFGSAGSKPTRAGRCRTITMCSPKWSSTPKKHPSWERWCID